MEREDYLARYDEAFVGDLVPMVIELVEEYMGSAGVSVPEAVLAEARAMVVMSYAYADAERQAYGDPESTPFRKALLSKDPYAAAAVATPEQLGYLGLILRAMPVLDGALDSLVHEYGTMSSDSRGRYIATGRRG